MTLTNQANTHTFLTLGIAPVILERLSKLKFTVPTPIQQQAIPIALEGKDIMGIAQTGTGKTLAFAIPIIQRLSQLEGRCLIVVPTRELAIQVNEVFLKFNQIPLVKTAVLIGGASMHEQMSALRGYPRILVATPGRLIDHLNQNHIHLGDTNIVVLDEADRMLDMGFAPDIELIFKHLPRERQTMLFSATMPGPIVKLAMLHTKLPVRLEIAPSGTAASKITQEIFIVRKESKKNLLAKILKQYHGSILLFSRTKIGARKISRDIRDMGHRAAEIHSDKSLPQRREALDGFKRGKYRILVATDIAARGIDVSGIELVINYDLPDDAENYVHRIGRTGRAGLEGHSISFAAPDQGEEVRNIEKVMRKSLPISHHPELPKESFVSSSAPKAFGYKRPRQSGQVGGHKKSGFRPRGFRYR